MPTPDTHVLERQTRKAYEVGRFKRALRILGIVVPLIAASLYVCGISELGCAIGALLAATSVGFLWRGEAWGRAVGPGLKGGIAAFLLPITLHAFGYCCRHDIETLVCVASGMLAGLVVGFVAIRGNSPHRTTHLFCAGAIAALTASLGCLALGLGGALGVAGGVLLVVAPFAIFSLARP